MVITVDDEKINRISEKNRKNINGVRDVRHYLQGLLQGLPQKGQLTWYVY